MRDAEVIAAAKSTEHFVVLRRVEMACGEKVACVALPRMFEIERKGGPAVELHVAANHARLKLPANCCPPAIRTFTNSAGLSISIPPMSSSRELGFLFLRMSHKEEAEREFQAITDRAPGDMLSAAQLHHAARA